MSARTPRLSPQDLWLVAYATAAAVVCRIPARWVLAEHHAQTGVDPLSYLLASLMLDLRDWAWLFVAVPLVAALALRRVSPKLVVTTSWVLFPMAWFAHVAAAQFKLERGIFPTMFDASQGGGDAGFVMVYLSVFAQPPIFWTSVIAYGALAAMSVLLLRTGPRETSVSWRWRVPSVVALTALLSLGGHALHGASAHGDRIESPLVVFFEFGTVDSNVQFGALWLFKNLELSPDDGAGARLLGLSPKAAAAVNAWQPSVGCAAHPLSLPLYEDTPLRGKLRALSHALWDGRDAAPVIWHIALEGIRGDDTHAVHAAAPRAITPVISALYERPTTIKSRHVYQSGYRTSQGLAALFCGLGTAPYGVSLIRDLGNIPLRCLPDVFKDAGLSTAQYIGSSPTFDAKYLFAGYHGFDVFMSQDDYVEHVPRTAWGIPDVTMFEQSHDEADERSKRKTGQYNFILSLSNHAPHIAPGDMPPALQAEVEQAFETSGQEARQGWIDRMSTYAYTDHAVGVLVGRLEKAAAADRTIAVVVSDHGIHSTYLWRGDRALDGSELMKAHALIPLVIVLPQALIEASADAGKLLAALADLNEALATIPLSQNDIALMTLDLVSASAPMRALDPAWAWHTMGGQRLSPHFAAGSALGKATVLGINNLTRVFTVDDEFAFGGSDEVARISLVPADAASLNPTMLPAASLLSRFLRGYAAHCWSSEHIRKRR